MEVETYMSDIEKLLEELAALYDQSSNALRAGAGVTVDKPTAVYRIEMSDGVGPYTSQVGNQKARYAKLCSKTGWDCARLARENNEQMGITESAFRTAHGHAAYACPTLEAIDKWFPEDARRYLAKNGAKLVQYIIPVGGFIQTVSENEVIFSRPDSRRVATLDMVTFEKTGD